MDLEIRKVKVYDLPLDPNIRILRPEQVILRFSHGMTVDIGSLCYLVRQPALKPYLGAKRHSNEGRLVQINSISEQRVKDIRLVISFISNYIIVNGKRAETIRDMVSRFVAFMFWVDQNKFYDVLSKHESTKKSLFLYIQYLKERVLRNEITINSAARQQNTVIHFLEAFLEDEELSKGLTLLRINNKLKVSTQPPNENEEAKILTLCEHIFDGLSSLVLDNKKYPYKLAVPSYLNFEDNKLWVFPAESWFIHPENSQEKRNSCLAYNYLLGTMNTLEEIENLRLRNKGKLKYNTIILNDAIHNINAANNEFHHSQRKHVGTIALNAFIILFLAQTGMSWAQLIQLKWHDDFQITSSHQLFRTIKWRANRKECSFELPVGFMTRFKKFLALRKYILNNNSFDLLFFNLGERGLSHPKQMKSIGLNNIYSTLQRIDLNLEKIQSREWRAAKSDWLIRKTDVSTTALVLQNTEKTVLSSYISGSESKHWEEMSDFFNNVSGIISENKKGHDKLLQGAIGQCSSYGEPSLISKKLPIKPDCVEPEGCLFCDKYRIHVDEIDIRKLLSCRYCIEKTAYLIGSIEDQNLTVKPIIDRINSILSDLKKYNLTLVERISSEVEEGELDTYWARKLEMFIELDLIS